MLRYMRLSYAPAASSRAYEDKMVFEMEMIRRRRGVDERCR
jgi:hypothetical protein